MVDPGKTLIPTPLVDALPERLWWLGNLYFVFGRTLHLCIRDGYRTVEFDGQEIGRGRKPLDGFHRAPSDAARDRSMDLDFGLIALVSLIIAGSLWWSLRRAASGRFSGDMTGH
jgi:hypothetical protein